MLRVFLLLISLWSIVSSAAETADAVLRGGRTAISPVNPPTKHLLGSIVPAVQISETKVLLTFMDGKLVYGKLPL